MSPAQAPTDHVYVPDPEVEAILRQWHRIQRDQASLQQREQETWERLNEVLNRQLGADRPATFILDFPDVAPGKAGRHYPVYGAGVDYAALRELVLERMGEHAMRRWYDPERVTRWHPNREAIEAHRQRDEVLDQLVLQVTSDGTPKLTRIPPAKASKELAKAARPMPARSALAGRRRRTSSDRSAA